MSLNRKKEQEPRDEFSVLTKRRFNQTDFPMESSPSPSEEIEATSESEEEENQLAEKALHELGKVRGTESHIDVLKQLIQHVKSK